MTITATSPAQRQGRRGPALGPDERAAGLRRRVIATSVGPVVVRAGTPTGDVATIFLHGAAGSWTTWTPLLRAAEQAGVPLTGVLAIDLPGWGESATPPSRVGVAQMGHAIAEVADAFGYPRFMLVGHSLGGFLALDVASRHRARTEGVLLVSTSGPAVLDAIRRPVRGGRRLPAFAGMLLIMRVLALFGGSGRALVAALHRLGMLRALSAPLFADPAHVHGSVIDALSSETRPRAFADAAMAAAHYDETRWRGIACPVRAVRGNHDVFVAPSDAAKLSALIADFTESTIPGAGHFAAIEQPIAVLRALRGLPAPPADANSG